MVKKATPPLQQIVSPDPSKINRITERIDSRAKIVFIAACKLGPPFKSLWDITDTTQGRALIVPTDGSIETNLSMASGAWTEISRALSHGQTAAQAVQAGNLWLQTSGQTLRFQVVGDGNVKAR